MRITVFSDSHGDVWRIHEVVEANLNSDLFIFLGDGAREFDDICAMYPNKRFIGVRGNCDFASDLPAVQLIPTEYGSILCTHGHLHSVKGGDSALRRVAREHGARIVLYGHTHEAKTDYEDGLYIMCPGSVSHPRRGNPTYGRVDILPNGIMCNIVALQW